MHEDTGGFACAACGRRIVRHEVAVFRGGSAFHLSCYSDVSVVAVLGRLARREDLGRRRREQGRDHRRRERAHGTPPAPPPAPAASPSPAARRGGQLAGVRVLVVEDNPDDLDLVAMFLRHAGAAVTPTSSAEEALLRLRAAAPDIVLTDLVMPGQDGFDVLRRIRAHDPARGGRVPIIALTAHADEEDRRRTLAAGFTAHVAKPVDWDLLIETVRQALGRGA